MNWLLVKKIFSLLFRSCLSRKYYFPYCLFKSVCVVGEGEGGMNASVEKHDSDIYICIFSHIYFVFSIMFCYYNINHLQSIIL